MSGKNDTMTAGGVGGRTPFELSPPPMIGLLPATTVVYILLGGALFVGLEAQQEQLVQTDVLSTRDEYVRRLWNVTEQMNVLHPDNWSAVAEQLLERYAYEVYVATKKRGWDGRQENDDGDQWNFASSLLYAITVVTTIGTPVRLRPITTASFDHPCRKKANVCV